jgi:hypothetical protein
MRGRRSMAGFSMAACGLPSKFTRQPSTKWLILSRVLGSRKHSLPLCINLALCTAAGEHPLAAQAGGFVVYLRRGERKCPRPRSVQFFGRRGLGLMSRKALDADVARCADMFSAMGTEGSSRSNPPVAQRLRGHRRTSAGKSTGLSGHSFSPAEKAPKRTPLGPGKSKKREKPDRICPDSRVRFNPPPQER